MIDTYDWPGGREAMLRFGPAEGPVVVAALPLFEEANRTRAFVVTILRMLAERGIAGALPDLPGQGESLVPLEDVTSLVDMQIAYAEAVKRFEGRHCYALSVRGGVLVDTHAWVDGRWHLSPLDGPQQLRELRRIKQADLGKGETLEEDWASGEHPITIAGNRIAPGLLLGFKIFEPWYEGVRTVRLESDPAPADAKFPGPPLWRRAEPENDPALAALLADDIADWVRACEG